MELEVFTTISRPVATVWDFYAVNHIENHPRWDPTLRLKAMSDRPLGVGSVIRRTATRFGETTEGTMEILEFEPEKTMRVETHDGPTTIYGWVYLEPVDDDTTNLVLGGEFPDMEESMADQLRPMMENSARTIKSLIESET